MEIESKNKQRSLGSGGRLLFSIGIRKNWLKVTTFYLFRLGSHCRYVRKEIFSDKNVDWIIKRTYGVVRVAWLLFSSQFVYFPLVSWISDKCEYFTLKGLFSSQSEYCEKFAQACSVNKIILAKCLLVFEAWNEYQHSRKADGVVWLETHWSWKSVTAWNTNA